jgi:hypothetical protein
MPATIRTLLDAPAESRAPQVALLAAQLDDLHRRLRESIADIDAAELAWQLAPGTNTIGMLLAHLAYAEAHMAQIGILGEATGHAQDVVGIREEDEGMPLPPDGRPPAALAGKGRPFFVDALDRARDHTRRALEPLTDRDLDRLVVRKRPDGTERVFDVRWLVHHLVEHFAGHYGQILLLRHLYKDMRRRGGCS